MVKKIWTLIVAAILLFNMQCVAFADEGYAQTGFTLVSQQHIENLSGTAYYFKHMKTGAEVVYVDNGAEKREFSIGFKTPPKDNKGANHVLEHSLLCGSEKYPVKNIMSCLNANALAEEINAYTSDDCTYYTVKTKNETEYYNLMDVYLNGIFHPLLLTEENIFRQQGIRKEYQDGAVQYNGVVYNELRIKSLESSENSVNFLADKLYTALYGETTPAFNSGGTAEDIKDLTYEDLLRVYRTYYTPSNSMTCLVGKQDILKTLSLLNKFFNDSEPKNISIAFPDTKQTPAEPICEFNITENTKTVDIGFMSSGVPMHSVKEVYARDILFNLVMAKMDEVNSKNYVSGGNTGGISNLALLVSEVPIEQKDEMIAHYKTILSDFETQGISKDDLNSKIDSYIEERKNPYGYSTELNVFNGLVYTQDPFSWLEMTEIASWLKGNPDYFNTVLETYFTKNPYSVIVVSGNGAKAPVSDTITATAEELEQIRQDTEDFNAWVNAPEDPEAVARIPSLTLDEVDQPPDLLQAQEEKINQISYFSTVIEDRETDSASLFFDIGLKGESLNELQLMNGFLNYQLQKSGLDGIYFELCGLENAKDDSVVRPMLCVGMNAPSGEMESKLNLAMEFLLGNKLWNEEDFKEYLKTAADDILKNGYRDPYFVSYELMQSAQSMGKRFNSVTRGSIGQGSLAYFRYLKQAELSPEETSRRFETVKTLANRILSCAPFAEYVGSQSGSQQFKATVAARFGEMKAGSIMEWKLPVGYPSAATITTLDDADHFMLAGFLTEGGYAFSGKMNIMTKVVASKYLYPVMRGQYGAYGAGMNVDGSTLVCAVAGLKDIDLAVQIWSGMGNFLRNLEMTQKELDGMIVSAINEFDEWEANTENGAFLALSGKTAEDIKQVRREMLSTTVEDVKSYADFVDDMAAQNRIFAVLGKDAADKAKFEFPYYADAKTLTVSPRLKRNAGGYMTGKAENTFQPDAPITRAETAAIFSRLMADQRPPEEKNYFQDVSDSDWFSNAVASVTEKGVLNGYGDGSFCPNKNITRAEFAAAASKFLFGTVDKGNTQFADVSETHWAYNEISKMADSGLLNGYDGGMFLPDQPITRAEAVTVMNKMLGKAPDSEANNPFSDLLPIHWAYADILAAIQ